MMLQFKKNNGFNIFVMLMMIMMSGSSANDDDSSSSLTAHDISTDTTQTSSYSNVYESPEKMSQDDKISNINIIDGEITTTTTKTTISSVVLQPNIANALDVGQGLLVPLVPVVDSKSKNNQPQTGPLVANLLPVAVETITPTDSATAPETRPIDNDMDVAEDIIFRPLFRYRQEAAARRKSYNQYRYYQPYIYALKKSRQNNYDNDDNDQQRSRYYPRYTDD